MRASVLASVLRWLGPWSAERVPPNVGRETLLLREGAPSGFRADRGGARPEPSRPRRLVAHLYRPPGRTVGSYLVVPGLHFLGPDDPRLDRFCRILAGSGFVVLAPIIPTFADLIVGPSAPDDLEIAARELLRRRPGRAKPAMFSISFGSWPALEVAARLGPEIDGVITFGGYGEFDAAVRFCVEGVMHTEDGPIRLERDPLNQPALFLNVLPHLDVPGDTTALELAWRRMAYRTWGKMELKASGRLDPIARELAASVSPSQRELFLVGCGVRPGALPIVEAALDRSRASWQFADPASAAPRLRCPVVVCHGRDDDVIPWGEAIKLHRLLETHVPVRVNLTGLFGHTGAERPSLRDGIREARALLSIARAIASGGALQAEIQ